MFDKERAAQKLAERASSAFDATDPDDWRWLEEHFDNGQKRADDYSVYREMVRRKKAITEAWAGAMGWKLRDGSYDLEKVVDGVNWLAGEHLDHVQGFAYLRKQKLIAVLSHSYNPHPIPEPIAVDWRAPGAAQYAAVIRLPRSWYFPRGNRDDITTAYLFARLEEG